MKKIALLLVAAFCFVSNCLLLTAASQSKYLPVKQARTDSITIIGKSNTQPDGGPCSVSVD